MTTIYTLLGLASILVANAIAATKSCVTGDYDCYDTIPPNACSVGGIPMVETLKYGDPALDDYFQRMQPVVISESNMVQSASKWNAKYVARHGHRSQINHDGDKQPVALKTLRSHNLQFLYGMRGKDDSNKPGWKYESSVNFTYLTFDEFATHMEDPDRDYHFYVQQEIGQYEYPAATDAEGKKLVAKMGPRLEHAVRNFRYDLPNQLDSQQWRKNKNLRVTMWMGERGTVTPIHFDNGPGLLAQAVGSKCALVIPNTAENFEKLAVYPWFHPNTRQSRVASTWDHEVQKFNPLFLPDGMTGIKVAHIKEGEMLYLPGLHLHEIASIQGDPSRSDEFGLSFTFAERDTTTNQFRYANKYSKRILDMLTCEDKIAFRVGHKDYGEIFKALDESFEEGRELEDIHKEARYYVEQECKEHIGHLKDGETYLDFFKTYYSGRFAMLKQGWDGSWPHEETYDEYADRTRDHWMAPNTPERWADPDFDDTLDDAANTPPMPKRAPTLYQTEEQMEADRVASGKPERSKSQRPKPRRKKKGKRKQRGNLPEILLVTALGLIGAVVFAIRSGRFQTSGVAKTGKNNKKKSRAPRALKNRAKRKNKTN